MLLNQTWYLFLNSFIRIHNVSRVLTLITYCRNYFHSTIKYDRSVLHFEQASVKIFEWKPIEFEVQNLHYTVYGISSEICSKHEKLDVKYRRKIYWINCVENKYLHSKNMHEISLVSTRRRILWWSVCIFHGMPRCYVP